MAFWLPDGARQGTTRWYLIRLNLTLDLAADSGEGQALVSGLTNGRAAAQIEIEAHRRRDGAPVAAKWSTIGLVDGIEMGTARDGQIELTYLNYLQDRGVRPGENTLAFELEQLGDIRVDRAVVEESSGVVVDEAAPARLVLAPVLPEEDGVPRGGRFEVGYELRNAGGRPAHDVFISLRSVGAGLRVESPVQKVDRVLDRVSGTFTVRASRVGAQRLRMEVRSTNANEPVASVAVPVERTRPPSEPSHWLPGMLVIGGCAALALGVSAASLRGRRRRRYSGA